MHNIWLIAEREYLERIRTKSFLIMTILIPALMGGRRLRRLRPRRRTANRSSAHHRRHAGRAAWHDLQSELEAGRSRTAITVDLISPPGSDTRDRLEPRSQLHADLDGYLWVTPSPASSSPARNIAQWVTKSKARTHPQRGNDRRRHSPRPPPAHTRTQVTSRADLASRRAGHSPSRQR